MLALATKNEQYGVYKKQNVLTAGPGELTLMLYDGCIKNLKLAKIYISEKNVEKTNEVFLKAFNIVAELMQSLDLNFDISHQLLAIYDFISRTIAEANMAKDVPKTDIAIELVTDLRDTWQQVIKLSKSELSAGSVKSGFAVAAE